MHVLRAALLPVLLLVACDDKPAEDATMRPRPVKAFRVADADLVAGRTFPGQARSGSGFPGASRSVA